MKVSRELSLAGVLVLAVGFAPAGAVHGQSRHGADMLIRAAQVGRGSHIGVTVQDIEESDKKDVKSGIVVETVDSGGPAEKAGIKPGDAIVEFDGDRVRSVRQFQRLVQESAPGRAVGAVLSRGGQRVTVNITPDQSGNDFGFRLLESPRIVRPAMPTPPAPATPRAAPAPPMPPAFDWFNGDGLTIVSGRGRIGITTESISGQLADYFGVKDGALVKSVEDGSAAAKAGVKAGDVITNINGSHVYDPSDVSRAFNRLDEGAEFTVEVVRDHKTQTLKGKVEARTQRRRSGAAAYSER
jgi:serine protease Do